MPGKKATECSGGPTQIDKHTRRSPIVLWSWSKLRPENASEGDIGPCVTSALVMFMYVHEWEEETGFPMGLGKKSRGLGKKWAQLKAVRATKGANHCSEIPSPFWGLLCSLFFEPNTNFSILPQLVAQTGSWFWQTLHHSLPKDIGLFHKNCVMKITEYTFEASECHCDLHRGRGLNKPHPTTLNSCSLSNFLCTPVCFLFDSISSLYQHHSKIRRILYNYP